MKNKKRNTHEFVQEKHNLIEAIFRRGHTSQHLFSAKKTVIFSFMLLLSSCNFHMDASLEEISKKIPTLHLNDGIPREIIEGETVTTPSGVVVKGSFGEIMEKKFLITALFLKGLFLNRKIYFFLYCF